MLAQRLRCQANIKTTLTQRCMSEGTYIVRSHSSRATIQLIRGGGSGVFELNKLITVEIQKADRPFFKRGPAPTAKKSFTLYATI